MNSGLGQGDSLSPILFYVVLEKLIREMKVGPHECRLRYSVVGLSAYADDIVLMEKSQDRLKISFSRLYKTASKVELQVSEEKRSVCF